MLFLRKGRIAKTMVFATKFEDWRRPECPGNSTSEKKNACEIECFFGSTKKTSGYHCKDFGVQLEDNFCIMFFEKTSFVVAGVFFFNFVMFCHWEGVGGGGVAHLALKL